MIRYLVQPRDWIFVKSYWFLSFAKNMIKSVNKSISKNLSGKHSPGMLAMRWKRLNHDKQSATDVLKLLQKE